MDIFQQTYYYKILLRMYNIVIFIIIIIINLFVHFKITFDGPKATAVTFRHRNKTVTVTSRKEILLTSGTIGSAKLLLLSGIGPKEHLEQLKVNK